MKAESFKIFLNKLCGFPLWIKQIIYFELRNNLKNILVNQNLNVPKADIYQLFQPSLTFAGKKELDTRNNNHEENLYKFLQGVAAKKNVIDITLDGFLTLEETSKIYILAMKNEYISPSGSEVVEATAEFLAGKIKTGEYLLKIGRLTVDQLNIAIRQQKKLQDEGKKCYMAELLSSLEFIEKDEMMSILIMKEESKKRFIFNMEMSPGTDGAANCSELQKQIEQLSYENNYLKTKLRKILQLD